MAVSSLVARSLFRSAIPKLFAGGYSFNKASDYMKGQIGSLYRRQTAQADWREITGVEKMRTTFKYIPRKYRFSGQLAVPRAGKMSTNYQYLYSVKGFDSMGNPMQEQFVSLLDDVRLAPALAEQIMLEQIQDPDNPSDPQAGMVAYNLELIVIYRNRDVTFEKRPKPKEEVKWT